MKCNHLIGWSGDDDYSVRVHHQSEFEYADAGRYVSLLIDLDGQFKFCPQCGARIDWEMLECSQEAWALRQKEIAKAEVAVKIELARSAMVMKLYKKRMRGASYETW